MKNYVRGFIAALVLVVVGVGGASVRDAYVWTQERYQEFLIMREVTAIILPEVQAKVRAAQEAQKAQQAQQPAPSAPAAEK